MLIQHRQIRCIIKINDVTFYNMTYKGKLVYFMKKTLEATESIY